jgi:hypothetical protein
MSTISPLDVLILVVFLSTWLSGLHSTAPGNVWGDFTTGGMGASHAAMAALVMNMDASIEQAAVCFVCMLRCVRLFLVVSVCIAHLPL